MRPGYDLFLIPAGKPACISGSDRLIFTPTRSPPARRWSESVAAAAIAAAATVAGEFRSRGDAPELDRLGHGFFHGPLQIVHLFLRVEEVRGDGVFQQRVTVGFKRGDIRRVERFAGVLFFLKRPAFAHQAFMQLPRGGVGPEGVDAPADAAGFAVFEEGFAEFARFGFNFF